MNGAQRTRFEQSYITGNTPWDTRQTPPEVQHFCMSGRLPRGGTALDLGCGAGTNLAYLARLGLSPIGIDYVIQPLALAQDRLRAADPQLARRVRLVLGDVTNLPFAGLDASYILDIGCLHAIPPHLRHGYVQGIIDNLAPGGYYHLFAFDRSAELTAAHDDGRGLAENEVADRFAPHLQVVEIQRARPDDYPCRWYLLQR